MRLASGSRDDHLASRSARGRQPTGHFPAPARTPISPRSRRGVRRPLRMRGADLIGLARVKCRRARRRLVPQPHQRAAARRASRALGRGSPRLGPGGPEHEGVHLKKDWHFPVAVRHTGFQIACATLTTSDVSRNAPVLFALLFALEIDQRMFKHRHTEKRGENDRRRGLVSPRSNSLSGLCVSVSLWFKDSW